MPVVTPSKLWRLLAISASRGPRGLLVVFVLVGAAVVPAAQASFPGANGLLAVTEVTEVGFGCCGGGSEPEENFAVNLVDPSSGRVIRRISDCREPECFDGQPAWSPAGRWLAFSRGASNEGGIYAVRADGTGLRRIIPFGSNPAWSPDGRRLVFQRDDACCAQEELFVVRRDGSGLRRLTFGGGYEPVWGATGRIAFARTNPQRTKAEIYTVRPNGRGLRRLARGIEPEWSPGATKIAFQSDYGAKARGVFVMTATGRVLGRVARGNAKSPVWSPDGRLIAFRRSFDSTYVTRSSLRRGRRSERRVCLDCIASDWQPLPR